MLTAAIALLLAMQPVRSTPLNPSAACSAAKDASYCAELLPMIDSVDAQASLATLHELIAKRGWPTEALVGKSASAVALTLLERASVAKAAAQSIAKAPAAVARIWKGRVPKARADEYQRYLAAEGVRKIYGIPNNLGAEMLRRDMKDGSTEFIVISYWPSREAIRAFAGSDIEKVHELPRDREFLIRGENKVQHFDVEMERDGTAAKK